MSRRPLAVFLVAPLAAMLAALAGAQQPPPTAPLPPDEDAPVKTAPQTQPATPPAAQQKGKATDDEDLPPDEDAASAAASEKVAFNPVLSNKDVMVGIEYFKKGNYKAAAGRFHSAIRYNESNAKAWQWLGEAEEKREAAKDARAAYEKYLQLAPKAKNAPEIRKRLEKLN